MGVRVWTDEDVQGWIALLAQARTCHYPSARKILVDVRNQIGEATRTEAQKQKRERFLQRRADRKRSKAVTTNLAADAVLDGDELRGRTPRAQSLSLPRIRL